MLNDPNVVPKRMSCALLALLLPLMSACGGGSVAASAPSQDTVSAAGPMATIAAVGTAATSTATVAAKSSLRVQVSATASDPNGRKLHYRWRSTDGVINDVDSPNTTWDLVDGPGLHFAYVLVSNGAGGYTERRVAVSTDAIGVPIAARSPLRYRAPAAKLPVGETYRGFMASGATDPDPFASRPNVPDVAVVLRDQNGAASFPATGSVRSDLRGQYVVSSMIPIPATDPLHVDCQYDPMGSFTLCGDFSLDDGALTSVPAGVAVTDYFVRPRAGGQDTTPVTGGRVRLADGSPCGTVNEFFGVSVTGTATLVDSRGREVAYPARLGADGAYVLPYRASAKRVVLRCEGAPVQRLAVTAPGGLPLASFTGTAQPVVSAMAASLNGTSVGIFLPPPTNFPSDIAPDPERFLSYKGIDTLDDACAYYRSIGAARGCDAHGQLIDAISFDDWQRKVKLGKYALPGVTEYSARYINKADLNLARNHHSISYGPGQTAGYVCNHLGPKVLDPTQAEIDAVIDNLVQGKNLVACVAMDYSASPGVNGGAPFVRFLTFGPNGQLLLSVNLDGRREKYVPGTCVACHGGDHYAGHFLADGRADVGAHFLPYDPGNFEFSSKPGLTEVDQQDQLYGLNQNVLKTNATVGAQELIAGWYSAGGTSVDKNYVPASWRGRDQLTTDFYREVVAKSCRGCHVNMSAYNFDHYDNLAVTPYRYVGPDFVYTIGCNGANATYRSHSMPNSLVTFNRFWNSAGTAADQPALLNAFSVQATGGDPAVLNCTP